MASESFMESSLRRSSKLGQDVLEKAKRRSIKWPNVSANPSPMFIHNIHSERNFSHANLDQAFATIVEYMAETTRQCKAFYKSVHQAEPNDREHICRYHCQDMFKTSDQKQNAAVTIDRDFGTSEDFFIEVSPGTYSITAAMQDTRPVTKTVRITAGESKSLRFNL
ncbi:A-kinase-interacting protein 1 [Triplophysa dalaica]|uniref:A-kinase-interacting protein 1 n=1 Tax=Triplophysa dalaica TaxID=1582913 RepID=UPI0024DFF74B|nr:A-kinase-interacting protein 1 [Triplophysa dalaica]XP_056621821.1 A-kinase-interacting protein 1 [Triplophysa dalaica]